MITRVVAAKSSNRFALIIFIIIIIIICAVAESFKYRILKRFVNPLAL